MNDEMDIEKMYGQDGDIGPNPRISVLERDLAIAQRDLAAAQKMCDAYADENQRISDERDAARAEAAAVRADAERYRWLRDRRNGNAVRYVETYIEPDDLDAAIDAARGGGK